MGKLWKRITGFAVAALVLLPGLALAAGGGKIAPMVIVSDTRKLSGLMAWWGNMYNDSHLQFTLLTVLIIPVIGVIFGTIADIIMTHIGIDLHSRDLAEH